MQAKEYYRATSVEEAVSLLSAAGSRGRALAGGTDVIVQVRENRRAVEVLVDLKAIPELTAIEYDPLVGLRIGAAAACSDINGQEQIEIDYAALVDSTSLIGGTAIQSRASLGGNLCTSSPAGDSIPSLIALNAQVLIAGPDGYRTLSVEDFVLGPGRNTLHEGEIVVQFVLPPKLPRTASAYLRFIPRNEMDIAVASAGAWVEMSNDYKSIIDARVVIGGVAPTCILVKEAAAVLIGQPLTTEVFALAAQKASEAARPITDMRGSAAQRVHLTSVLARRAIKKAVARSLLG